MDYNEAINKNAAIYARVSTVDQDCSRQIADLNSFAERAGIKVRYTFKETASGAKNDRKQRAELMQLVREKKVDIILVTELTRWGRSISDLLDTMKTLTSYGVTVWTGQTGFLDNNSPTGKALLHMLALMAEFERDIISERTRSGLAAARRRGKQLGRPTGSGKTIKQHKKRVHELRDQKFSVRQIASKLCIGGQTVLNCLEDYKPAAHQCLKP